MVSKVFNTKGKPVKEYEAFFDEIHDFKFDEKFVLLLLCSFMTF